MSDFSCSRIDSLTGLLPSLKSIAKRMMKDAIQQSMELEKVADAASHEGKKGKARISDMPSVHISRLILSKVLSKQFISLIFYLVPSSRHYFEAIKDMGT
jgi:hypothetical protein